MPRRSDLRPIANSLDAKQKRQVLNKLDPRWENQSMIFFFGNAEAYLKGKRVRFVVFDGRGVRTANDIVKKLQAMNVRVAADHIYLESIGPLHGTDPDMAIFASFWGS